MEATIPSIPGYEIHGELGRGGMGVVYKAQDLRHDRPVALKMILSGRGAVVLELARFRIEAEAIASLAHPNIVLIHEVGVHFGFPFFVLEYAEGGNLAQKIRAQPMPCDWTAQITLKLALAMQHAHERGIIHRNLKPANVLMMTDDIPKIADFGLAKFTTPDATPSELHGLMSISVSNEFQELGQLHKDFRRGKENFDDDLSTAFAEMKRRPETPTAEDERRFEDIRKFMMEALRKRIKEDADEDLNTDFQEYVVRTEWERKMGAPSAEDKRRLENIRKFIQEATLPGVLGLAR
jgi:serine/threonine protein kinase